MIHLAGPYIDLVQRCTRCDVVLTDHRHSMVPEGQPALNGWEEGAHVERIASPGFTAMQTVTDPPDCERVS